MELTKEQKLYQDVIQKAWEDAEFKKELIANPLDAVEKLTGIRLNLPEGKTIVVRDQTDESKVYINIPAKPNMDDVELKEEQLESVAGGIDFPWKDIFDNPIPPCFPGPNPIDDITEI